jgi:hypothetical protein
VKYNLSRNQIIWFWMFVNAYFTSLFSFCWVWRPTCHWLICILGAQTFLAFSETSTTIIIDHWYMDYIYPNSRSMIHVREWNIMNISKLQVWWVIDWTKHDRSQTCSSCATIEGPKHFPQVKQNYVHKPTDEQTFVVFNL